MPNSSLADWDGQYQEIEVNGDENAEGLSIADTIEGGLVTIEALK
jgi:hypothetical protein